MQRVEISTRLPDVTGAAHDGEPEQAALRRERLLYDDQCKPEQHGRQREAIAQKLRSGEPQPVGELAEDTQGTEADRGADDERDPGRVSIRGGRRHPANSMERLRRLLYEDGRVDQGQWVVRLHDRGVALIVDPVGKHLSEALPGTRAAEE